MAFQGPEERPRVDVYSSCPQSADVEGRAYLEHLARVVRWSERHGCSGALIYADNRLVDPWLVAQLLVQETEELIPLVAVQPAYTHPYTVATMVASFAHLHGRRVALNLVAGGFRNDLLALGDATPHEQRYQRLIEFGTVIRGLTEGKGRVTLEGSHYTVRGLTLSPAVPPELQPFYFVSGSSADGRAAARALGARPVSYPKPPGEQRSPAERDQTMPGLRIGVIARDTREVAWAEARRRFPVNREGQIRHQLARKVSDSVWHQELSEVAERGLPESCYWLQPFENYGTMCPYLVGNHEEVAQEISRYLALGYRTFILDIPQEEEDLANARAVFERAQDAEVAA